MLLDKLRYKLQMQQHTWWTLVNNGGYEDVPPPVDEEEPKKTPLQPIVGSFEDDLFTSSLTSEL